MVNVLQLIVLLTLYGGLAVALLGQQQHDLQKARKVVVNPADLNSASNTIHILPRVQSLIQCGSLVLSDPNKFYQLFCMTPAGQCLLSNASYPAYYDDDTGRGSYLCYTIMKPLIDMSLYRPGVCLPPFENIQDVGCVYHNNQYSSFNDFAKANRTCRSYCPVCDLYTGPVNAALSDFIDIKEALDVYVGAQRKGPGVLVRADYYWVDGRQTADSEWTDSSSVGLIKPSKEGHYTFIPDSTPDCVILWTNKMFVYPVYKLGNVWCDEIHEFLCQMKL